MELFWKDTENGWRLFYESKEAMQADVDDEEFVAQHKGEDVMNFWGTINIKVRPGSDINTVVRRVLDMESELMDELA